MNFSKREKKYLIAGGTGILIFVLCQFFYFPVMTHKKELARVLEIRKVSLTDMQQLQKQVDQFRAHAESGTDILQSRDPGFSLFSFLDQQAQKSNVKQKVAYMQPFTRKDDRTSYSIAVVKLKLNDLYLTELVDFLSRVESEKNAVYITALSLSRTGAGQDLLEAVIEARTRMAKESQ